MLDNFHFSWYASLSIFSFIYFATSIVAYFLVPEEYLPEEQLGPCELASNMIDIMKVFYKRKVSNVLNLIDFCFLENQMFILLFWLPYYFNKLGYGYSSSYIALAYPICIVFGTIIFHPITEKFPRHNGLINSILIALSFLSFFAMLFFGGDQS